MSYLHTKIVAVTMSYIWNIMTVYASDPLILKKKKKKNLNQNCYIQHFS